MNVLSFLQWNKCFHSVKDEIFYSTRLRLVEWNISSFTAGKYFTIALINIHYLYTIAGSPCVSYTRNHEVLKQERAKLSTT